MTVVDLRALRKVAAVSVDLADNLAISDQDAVFVSSGNRLGIDVFALQADGTLVRTKSFFLGINRFVQSVGAPTKDEIRKLIFKR